MQSILAKLIASLPETVQQELRTQKTMRSLRRSEFVSPEPEFSHLSAWVREGDWVVDVGANIGHYTVALGDLVGSTGRVIAFEPMPETFTILSRCVARAGVGNISLLNAAASERFEEVSMILPTYEDGISNYYQASIDASVGASGGHKAIAFPIDALAIDHRVSLIKVDAEGYDTQVLRGAWSLITRDRPTLIVEGPDSDMIKGLVELGYREKRFTGSPNVVFEVASP